MVSRWYSSITDFDDIIRFRDHIWEVNRDAGVRKIKLSEREFPISLHVGQKAYFVMKEKVSLELQRQNSAILSALRGLFSGGATIAADFAKQVGGYLWEGWEDRQNEVRKAAGVIAGNYHAISNDDGGSMTLSYVYTSDNPYEEPPYLY